MNLLASEKAESETIGHTLLLLITILGVSVILLYGVPTIQNLEKMIISKNAEQTFAVQDSRASRAVLGDSPMQMTDINLGGGSPTVLRNSSKNPSYMVVNSSSFNFKLPMGKVMYQLGDRIVAYEDGGIWSKYPGGGSVMLSPPEFHYNGVTLTLPVFNVSGNASVGGEGTAAISFNKNPPIVRYPNASYCLNLGFAPTNCTNPVNYTTTGKVYVNITSDYYDAWAKFVDESINYAKVVEVNDSRKTVSIELRVVPSNFGDVTSIPGVIYFRGVDPSNPEPLNNFSFKIVRNPPNDFNNYNWQITAISGTKTLIFYLKQAPGNHLELRIGYQDTGLGYPASHSAEIWDNATAFPITGSTASVDLLNQSINMTYTGTGGVDVGVDNGIGVCIKIPQNHFNDTAFTWSGVTQNTQKSLYNVTQHYIWKMAQDEDFSFKQCIPSQGHGNQGPDPGSTMLLNYSATGALTYLHITDNKADVGIS